jgi:hypothetical protein
MDNRSFDVVIFYFPDFVDQWTCNSNALHMDNRSFDVVIFCFPDFVSAVLMQKKQSRIMKRKTRQGKALEKRTARSFMDVLQEVITLCYKFLSRHVYFLRRVLKRFSSGTVTGKSGIPASSRPNIFEGCCGSTKNFISTALLFSLW